MKKLLYAFILLPFLTACSTSEESSTFDSQELQGKYVIDLTPFIKDAVNDKKNNEFEQLFAGLVMSSLEAEVYFYENNQGMAVIDGYALKLAQSFSKKPVESNYKFNYKVEGDNMLYCKKFGDSDAEYEEIGQLKPFGGHYDLIELVFKDEKQDKTVTINLKKVKGN